jgi:hypothetical protein
VCVPARAVRVSSVIAGECADSCEKVGLKKGRWTAEEDQKLVTILLSHGHCCWRLVPELAGTSRSSNLILCPQLPCLSSPGMQGSKCRRSHLLAFARMAAEVREELPAAVDQLPEPRPQAGTPLRGGGGAGHRPPRAARQQVRPSVRPYDNRRCVLYSSPAVAFFLQG